MPDYQIVVTAAEREQALQALAQAVEQFEVLTDAQDALAITLLAKLRAALPVAATTAVAHPVAHRVQAARGGDLAADVWARVNPATRLLLGQLTTYQPGWVTVDRLAQDVGRTRLSVRSTLNGTLARVVRGAARRTPDAPPLLEWRDGEVRLHPAVAARVLTLVLAAVPADPTPVEVAVAA